MRRFLLPLLFVFLALSCQKQPGAPEISLSQEVLSLDSAAGSGTVELTVNRPWTATADVPWCKVIPASGNGFDGLPGDLHIVCEENPGHAERSCTVTIKSGDVTKTITVTQDHRDGFILQENEYSLSEEAQTLNIHLWKTGPCTFTLAPEDQEWLQVTDTKAMSPGQITLSVSENLSASRTATLSIRYKDQAESVLIHQSCGFVRFGDERLENYLLNTGFDQDWDGRISVDEALAADNLYILGNSPLGIEQFANITELYGYIEFKSLDLSPLKKLASVHLSGETLEDLILPESAPLSELSLEGTGIHSLLLDGMRKLTNVILLDNHNLSSFIVRDCPSLSYLNLSSSPLSSSLQIQDLPSLEELWISGDINKIESLLINNLPVLKKTYITYIPSLKSISLSNLPVLEIFQCEGSQVSSLDFSGFPSLKYLYCQDNAFLKALDIRGCSQLLTLSCGWTGLTAIDVSGCSQLTEFYCSGTALKDLDISTCPKLQLLDAHDGQLVSLAARNNPELRRIECQINQLERIDISGCPVLEGLFVSANRLTELDTSCAEHLLYLNCRNNWLKTLDLSGNPDLQEADLCDNPYLKTVYLNPAVDVSAIGYDPAVTTIVYK